MDEVEEELTKQHLLNINTLIVGVSMGGLIGFNMLKRHTELDKLLVITGGNMALIPKSYRQKWPISYAELERLWQDVNIYAPRGSIKNKQITMILPTRDKMIDPEDVAKELQKHAMHNTIRAIRPKGGHFRTIITETVLRPKRSLHLLKEMTEQLQFAVQVADRAGDIMLQHFQIGVANQTKILEGNTPVTIADTAVNSMVIEAIRKEYPSHAVIGEEESNRLDDAKYTWVCDPIDGTIPYVMGVPTNVFSLALVNKAGQPVVAVVYDPYMKRKYWAIKGGGAFMNDRPIRVNYTEEMSQAYIGMSSSRSKTVEPYAFKSALIKACYRPVILNCAIYEAMLVASGQMAATVYLGSGAHDVATSKLIVEEAGGLVTAVFGDEQRYDQAIKGAVISNGLLHDELVNLADEHRVRA